MCSRLFLAIAVLGCSVGAALADEPAKPKSDGPWGEPVAGIACRIAIGPSYVVGQPIPAAFELKNVSDKKLYLFLPRKDVGLSYADVYYNGCLEIKLVAPGMKEPKAASSTGFRANLPTNFPIDAVQAIAPNEVVQLGQVQDVREFFSRQLNPWLWRDHKANNPATGTYTLSCRFRSPPLPARFVTRKFVQGKEVVETKETPQEMLAAQWAHEVVSGNSTFELKPLAESDLVVHEWGVFTVFNDVKYANLNRKAEWSSLPECFYRQFPRPRLRWQSSGWDKPIVYFYAKPDLLHLSVKVTFTEGVPVAWWPCAADPVDYGWPGGEARVVAQGQRGAGLPFRSLTWEPWVGDRPPAGPAGPFMHTGELTKAVTEFPLPANCWVRQARLATASLLTVDGTDTDPKAVHDYWRKTMGGTLLRPEAERFLYYDGLVPTPDYLRCEKIDAGPITLRNRASFDLTQLFVVDRRAKDTVGFASIDSREPFKAGTIRKIEPRPVAAKDWPAEGLKQVRKALVDAGLFEPEADALLAIQRSVLLETEGVSVFHILPVSEYDRMLPLSILPAPVQKPVRVGIAFHPHMEIEPDLVARVTGLIQQLDDASFVKRDAAGKSLGEIGPMAIALLRAELKKNPPRSKSGGGSKQSSTEWTSRSGCSRQKRRSSLLQFSWWQVLASTASQ